MRALLFVLLSGCYPFVSPDDHEANRSDDDAPRQDGFVDDTDRAIEDCEEYYRDADADGFYADCGEYCGSDAPDDCITGDDAFGFGDRPELDCNDTSAFIYPSALEWNDGVDNDCVDWNEEGRWEPNYWEEEGLQGGADFIFHDLDGELEIQIDAVEVVDVDHDGSLDLVLGAQSLSVNAPQEGGALVFYAPRRGEARQLLAADQMLMGGAPNAGLGRELSADGDVDGDGFRDLLISGYGFAYFTTHLGNPNKDVTLYDSSMTWGIASAQIVGSLDGDGFAELAFASLDNTGRFWLLRGPVAPALSLDVPAQAYATITIGSSWSLTLANGQGDLDGDGRVDLVLGGPNESGDGGEQAGWVGVFTTDPSGTVAHTSADYSFHGAGADHRLGSSIVISGDYTGDGIDDLLLGAPGHGFGKGAIYLVAGSNDGLATSLDDAVAVFLGDDFDTGWQHTRVHPTGDFNGDGHLDLATGSGLYLGPFSGTYTPDDAALRYEQNGMVSAGRDLKSDGKADLILASWDRVYGLMGREAPL